MPWRARGATAIQPPGAAFGIGAALAAAGAVAWLALAELAPRPLVPRPGVALVALWALAFGLIGLKVAAGASGLRVGAWSASGLAFLLVAAAGQRSRRRRLPPGENLGHP